MAEALTQEAIGTESLTEAEVFTLTIEGGADARRLDQWLVGQLPELTRSRIQSLAKAGHLTDQDGRVITKLSAAPQPGMTLILTLPPAEPVDIIPEDIPLDILYEDEDLIALNKPAGLVVHPACGHSHGTLVNALLYHCPDLKGIGGEKRPGIVHRLDMDTSGILLFAKTVEAAVELRRQFEEHTISKTYLARLCPISAEVCKTELQAGDKGRIELSLAPDYDERPRQKVDRHQGKNAVTEYEVISNNPDGTIDIIFHPVTGRTHQLRVHSAHHLGLGRPILGDMLYGGQNQKASPANERLHLHAQSINFAHPITGERITLSSSVYTF